MSSDDGQQHYQWGVVPGNNNGIHCTCYTGVET